MPHDDDEAREKLDQQENEAGKDLKVVLRFRTEEARKAFKQKGTRTLDDLSLMNLGLVFAGVTMWKWYPKTSALQLDSLAGNDPLSEEFSAVTSWKKIVHQSDRKRLEESLRRFEDSGYKVLDCAFRLATTVPQWVHARDMYHVYGPDGSPAMVAGLFFDITESELAKEKMYWGRELLSLVRSGAASWLRMLAEFDRHKTDSGRIAHLREQCGYEFDSLLQKSTVPCFKKNARFEYTDINEAFETLIGLTAAEVLHRTDEDIHGKEVGARTRRIYRNVLKQEQGEVTFHHLDSRGKSSFLILECYPDWGPDQRVQGIDGVLLPLASNENPDTADTPRRRRISAAMQDLNLKIQLAARCDSIILLTGESGSGKDYMAHRIHELSDRADKPFLNLNCGGLSVCVASTCLWPDTTEQCLDDKCVGKMVDGVTEREVRSETR